MGEYANATSYLVEYAPERRRGLYGSWTYATIGLALMVGAALSAVMTSSLSEDAISSWGRRVPFLVSAPVGLVGFYLRMKLDDSPRFRALREADDVAGAPLLTMLKTQLGNLVMTVGIVLIGTAGVYISLLYMPTYYTEIVGLSLAQALTANVIGLGFFVLVHPPLGSMSDRVGRRPLIVASAITPLVVTYPAFLLASMGTFAAAVGAQILLCFSVALWTAVAPTVLVEIFPTKVRASSLSVGYSVAVSVFGGLSPFVVTYIHGVTGSSFAPAFYVIGAAAVTLVAASFLWETAREDLR